MSTFSSLPRESPHSELPGLSGCLTEHENVSHPDRAHDVPGDDPSLVAALEYTDLDLGGLAGHTRAADDLNDL